MIIDQFFNQLIDDIIFHNDKSAYRLGTLVIHIENGENEILNIVDGQQRTLTLTLIAYAIIQNFLMFYTNNTQPNFAYCNT